MREVLDLFSAAAGGWSLGMHRAGYHTIAACEVVPWRRAVYAENNPDVRLYDDVRTLTAGRLLADLGRLPSIVVASPPCQDISSANTKGKGVEGERSGLYFEAIRIIGEVRPRWAALENSANLRTRGADAVLAALEELSYACWPLVVRAGDVGANHERPRCWLLACDVEQITDPDGFGRHEGWSRGRSGFDLSVSSDPRDAAQDGRGSGLSGRRAGAVAGAEQFPCGDASDAHSDTVRLAVVPGRPEQEAAIAGDDDPGASEDAHSAGERPQGQPGRDEPGQGEISERADISAGRQMGLCPPDRGDADRSGPDWSLVHLAERVLVDARISGWTFVAFLLDEGGYGCLATRLISELRSVRFAEHPSPANDLLAALKTLLASYSENTARNLAPIAATLSADFNITIAPDSTWEALAKSAEDCDGSRSIISTKIGGTTRRLTSKRSARHVTHDTTSSLDLQAVHRRAGRRMRLSASRLVEAYGDAVIPQIPEAIGRAIIRVEAALSAVHLEKAA